jgi:hypothetical protein
MVKIIPVPPRVFPDALRDPDLLPPPQPPSADAARTWGLLSIIGIPWVVLSAWRRWRQAGPPSAKT